MEWECTCDGCMGWEEKQGKGAGLGRGRGGLDSVWTATRRAGSWLGPCVRVTAASGSTPAVRLGDAIADGGSELHCSAQGRCAFESRCAVIRVSGVDGVGGVLQPQPEWYGEGDASHEGRGVSLDKRSRRRW